MGVSIYNIKRWVRMLTGKSIYHVEQGLGKAIGKGGYYNDLTQKVLLGEKNLDENGIPFLEHDDGSHIQILLLTFFYRYMRELITHEMLYIALPPLYRIAKGGKECYLYTNEELDEKKAELKNSAYISLN
mgnify:CR=1 FL=1